MVQHGMASVALQWGGTPEPVVAWFVVTWCEQRLCQVQGALADAKLPTWGIPAGDQLAMSILGFILAPWRSLIESIFPLVRTCMCANDGSRAARCTTSASPTPAQLLQAQQLAFDALLVTCDVLDDHICIMETCKQRRSLSLCESCEHLGLRASQALTTSPRLASLRDGWEHVLFVVACLVANLGPMASRNGLVATCILPKVRWVAPFVCPPPRLLDALLTRGIMRSASKLRCCARFWLRHYGMPYHCFFLACS